MIAEYNEDIYTNGIIDETKKVSFIEKISKTGVNATLVELEIGLIKIQADFKGKTTEEIKKWNELTGASKFYSIDSYKTLQIIKSIQKLSNELSTFNTDGLSVLEKVGYGYSIDKAIRLLKTGNNRFKSVVLDLPGPAMNCVMEYLDCKEQSVLLRTVKTVSVSLNVDVCSQLRKLKEKDELEKSFIKMVELMNTDSFFVFDYYKLGKFFTTNVNLNLTTKTEEDIYSISLKKGLFLTEIINSRYNLNCKYRPKHGRTPLTTPLIETIKKGEKYEKCFQLLLEKGANPNLKSIDQQTPLHAAMMAGSVENVKLLLKFGAVITDEAITCVREKISVEIFSLLVKDNIWINGKILLTISTYNRLEYLPILLTKIVNLNCRTIVFDTPLIIAAKKHYVHLVNALIKAGADPTLVDAKGITALEYLVKPIEEFRPDPFAFSKSKPSSRRN